MCHEILRDARFFELLLQFDQDIAAEVQRAGCPTCGSRVHAAPYPRKPRGGPDDLHPAYDLRLSYCCSGRDCRKRATPPSVRFLGRKVYLGAVVVLVSAMLHGASPPRMAKLKELYGVSPGTVARWRGWWLGAFAKGPFWKARAGRFLPVPSIDRFPLSLLESFHGGDSERLASLLRFLAPITTTSAGGFMAF